MFVIEFKTVDDFFDEAVVRISASLVLLVLHTYIVFTTI